MNVSRHVLRILTAAGFFFPAWPLAVYGREDEEPHAAAAVEEDSPVSGKDDIVVRPVNITGKVFSLDGSGSVDHFFFLPTMKDSREFFKVARPFVPVTAIRTCKMVFQGMERVGSLPGYGGRGRV